MVLLFSSKRRERQTIQIQYHELAEGRIVLPNRDEALRLFNQEKQRAKYQSMGSWLRKCLLLQK